MQVGANPRNKFLNVGALGLRDMSNSVQGGHVDELTLVVLGATGSIQTVSSMSIDWGEVLCDISSLSFILPVFSLVFG